MHPRLITAKRLFVKTVTKTLWSSGLKQSSHYQRWWGSSGLSFNLLFFIFLPTAFLTETTFVTVVYSSYLIHREALRIKPYNTVTLLWVHKNIKKQKKKEAYKLLWGNIFWHSSHRNPHIHLTYKHAADRIRLYQSCNLSLFMHINYLKYFLRWFLRAVGSSDQFWLLVGWLVVFFPFFSLSVMLQMNRNNQSKVNH